MFSNSAFRFFVVATRQSFRLLHGELQRYVKTGGSGTPRQHYFCPVCATRIYTGGEGEPTINLSVACLRQHADLRPNMQIWTRSSCAWLADLGDIPAYETHP